MSEPRGPNHVVAVVLALAAAGAFAYACVAQTWLHNPRNREHFEVGFGLLSNYECELSPTDEAFRGPCKELTNSTLVADWQRQLADIRERAREDPADPETQVFLAKATDQYRVSGAFAPLGYITLGCVALAALSLLVCAGLVLAKQRIAWPILPTTTAILGIAIGLVTGCVFVAQKPGPPGYVGVQLGFFAFGAGVLVGIVAALMMNKLLRPYDPDLLADAMDPEQY